MIKWEYEMLEKANHLLFLEAATSAGKEGWELVHIENHKTFWIGFLRGG